jgi:predicted metal-dependent phosphoesterase TrpH
MIDLHTHSTASDGILPPGELLKYAAGHGITALALTDHDTIEGLAEGAKAAAEWGIRFIPGIELTIEWKNGDFHLLGLGIQNPEALREVVENAQKRREDRNREIIEKMRSCGIQVTLEELRVMSGTSSIGRPHFADFLVAQGRSKTRQAAFERYLSKGRPFYVEHTGENLDIAIRALLAARGLPVIAHPLSLYVSWGKIEEVLADFRNRGIRGIEAGHPNARVNDCERLEKLAAKLGLFITAGSDFHEEAPGPSPNKKSSGKRSAAPHAAKIGYTAGGLPIDERFFPSELKKKRENEPISP